MDVEKPNCIGCHHIHPDIGNCTAVGGFCTAVPAAHCPLIPELRVELEQVKRERDAAVSWAQKYTESIDMPCVACKHNTGDYVCTEICGNCGPMGAESCKREFDFSGELKED